MLGESKPVYLRKQNVFTVKCFKVSEEGLCPFSTWFFFTTEFR